MRRFVLDTSAAVDLVTGAAEIGGAAKLQFFAPELIDLEFASVLRKLVARRKIDADLADAQIVAWAHNRVTRYPHAMLLSRIWQLRDNFSSYDASFVALAERLELPLVTTDARLGRAAQKYCEVITLDTAN